MHLSLFGVQGLALLEHSHDHNPRGLSPDAYTVNLNVRSTDLDDGTHYRVTLFAESVDDLAAIGRDLHNLAHAVGKLVAETRTKAAVAARSPFDPHRGAADRPMTLAEAHPHVKSDDLAVEALFNRDSHQWVYDDDGGRCFRCDARESGVAAEWWCGREVPRIREIEEE